MILKSRIMGKDGLVGFEVITSNYENKLYQLEDIITLAERGIVDGWEVVTDEDNVKHLYNDKVTLSELPSHRDDEITLETRITQDGKTIGFVCSDQNGKRQNIRLDKVWQLSKEGNIPGVEAYYSSSKNNRILVGNRINLSGITSIERK